MRITRAEYSLTGKRGNNEDCVFAGTLTARSGVKVHVAAVADGVGGGDKGEEASALVIRELRRFIESGAFEDPTALCNLLPAWADETNRKVCDLAETADSLVGTTLSAFLIHGETGLLVHIGDSAVHVVRKGRCSMVTHPHNSGWGVDEDMMAGPERRALERCFGLPKVELDLELNPIELDTPCRIIVSSDGMHESVPSAVIAQFARADAGLEELATDLVSWSLAAGSKDNSSVALLQVGEPETDGKKPAFPGAKQYGPPRAKAQFSRRTLLWLAAALCLLAAAVTVLAIVLWHGMQNTRASAVPGRQAPAGSQPTRPAVEAAPGESRGGAYKGLERDDLLLKRGEKGPPDETSER